VKKTADNNGYYMVLSGFADISKPLLSIIILQKLWTSNFGFVSLNIDVLAFFSALLTPWFIVYMQMAKQEIHTAYSSVLAVVYPAACLTAATYIVVSLILLNLAGGLRLDTATFIILRAISLILSTINSLNQCVLIKHGKCRAVLITQTLLLFWAILIYLSFGVLLDDENLVGAGLALLIMDITTYYYSSKKATKLTPRSAPGNWFEYKSVSHNLSAQRAILIPELGTALTISASLLCITAATFVTMGLEYQQYRTPLAFMAAMWLISSKIVNLLISTATPSASFFSLSDFLYTVRFTWYVPCLLLSIAYCLYPPHTDELFLKIATPILYFPAMIAVISINGTIRLGGKNMLLYRANLLMLTIYFFPASIFITFKYIPLELVIHAVGVSYLFRIGLIYWLHFKTNFPEDIKWR